MMTLCHCFARRVKSIRKNIIPSMASLLCMGLFSAFLFPTIEPAIHY